MTDPTPESYDGEALDSALMLARLDKPETEIRRAIAVNFSGVDVDKVTLDAIRQAAREKELAP